MTSLFMPSLGKICGPQERVDLTLDLLRFVLVETSLLDSIGLQCVL